MGFPESCFSPAGHVGNRIQTLTSSQNIFIRVHNTLCSGPGRLFISRSTEGCALPHRTPRAGARRGSHAAQPFCALKLKPMCRSIICGASNPTPETDSTATTVQSPRSGLAKRAIFGSILGMAGAAVILLGGWPYVVVTCLVAYQCSQEFIGLVNASGIAGGMKPPPPLISSTISLLCVVLNIWAFVSGGKNASAMAVAAFIVLSLQLLASQKPRFSQLTSAVFGLMYCGKTISFVLLLFEPFIDVGII